MGDSPLFTALLLAGIALVTVSLLLRLQRYRRRQRGKPMAQAQRQAGPSRAAPTEVNRWEVQMHETARELMAQLDSKISVLRAMVAEADRAAARLQRAQAGVDPDIETADQRPVDPDEVAMLADYGHSAVEIAQRLGRPVGHIEEILSQRGRS